MGGHHGRRGGLPPVSGRTTGSSFVEYLSEVAPELLPSGRALPAGPVDVAPHGTTIVALSFADGVLMAGDRRATAGNLIAQRDVEKVFPADDYSIVGVAGVAGIALEIVRLFQAELEHYEKIEGTHLTLDGKANRLAAMIRGNLGAAMQGLAAVPLFVGYDLDLGDPARAGRIYSYDMTGGRYEEHGYDAVGSGSVFAKSALKKRWREGAGAQDAVRMAVDCLYDAADDDTATGGPDLTRRLFPIVMTATAEGVVRVPDEDVAAVAETIVTDRRANPGG